MTNDRQLLLTFYVENTENFAKYDTYALRRSMDTTARQMPLGGDTIRQIDPLGESLRKFTAARAHLPIDGISLIPNPIERDHRHVVRFADARRLECERLTSNRLKPRGDVLIAGHHGALRDCGERQKRSPCREH